MSNGNARTPVTILIVDDEVGLVELIRSYLRNEGFTVLVADDGPSALDSARTHDPDLVVLDLMLPGLDGVEVCRRLRQFSNAYILMLTARSEEVDKIVGLSVGADDYVTKPFNPRELVARVKALLRRPRTGAQNEPDVPPVRRSLEAPASSRLSCLVPWRLSSRQQQNPSAAGVGMPARSASRQTGQHSPR